MSCGGPVITEPVILSSNPYVLCYDPDNNHFFERQDLKKIMGSIYCYDVKKLDNFIGTPNKNILDIKLYERSESLEGLYRRYFGDGAFYLEQLKQRILASYKAAKTTSIEPSQENYSWLFDQELIKEYHRERLKAIYDIVYKTKINQFYNDKEYNLKLLFTRALHQIEKNRIYVDGKLNNRIKKHLIGNYVSSVFDFHYETTWRIGVTSGFNPTNLKRGGEERKCIKSRYPGGQIWVFDYNAMDFRSMFFMFPELKDLAKQFENSEDFHETAAGLTNVSRSDFKEFFYPLIYGAGLSSIIVDRIQNVLKPLFDKQKELGAQVLAIKAQTYSSKIFACALIRAVEWLKDKKSKIIFTVHDEVVVDIHPEEHEYIESLISILQHPDGKHFYKVKIKKGNDYGETTS